MGPQGSGSGSRTFNVIFGLSILAAIGAGLVAAVYFVYKAVVDFLTSAAPEIGSAVIGTSGLVFVALVANFGAKYFERQQQIQQEQRTKKAEVYQEFMSFWFRLLSGSQGEDEDESTQLQDDLDEYIGGVTHQLIAWGSKGFLTEYVTFKEKIKSDRDSALLDFEKVLQEIRLDLGYKNKGLPRGILLKVFLDEPGVDKMLDVQE